MATCRNCNTTASKVSPKQDHRNSDTFIEYLKQVVFYRFGGFYSVLVASINRPKENFEMCFIMCPVGGAVGCK